MLIKSLAVRMRGLAAQRSACLVEQQSAICEEPILKT